MIHRSRRLADEVAEKLKMFAQAQRLMILSRLLDGECTVGEIETATGIGQPALSQQLAALRTAALVKTRRAAKQVYYRLADADTERCVASIETVFGGGERSIVPGEQGAAARPQPPARKPPPGHAGAAAFVQILRRTEHA
jgi:DNA-binding transcriptional ArsR family regulator